MILKIMLAAPMKPFPKILLFLCSCLLAACICSYGQHTGENPAPDDEEFNLFLFSLALVFTGALIGAALIGAFVAALALLLLFFLLMLGIVSSSVAVGWYKRSVSAGFKTFLSIVFSLGCTAISLGGLFLARLFLDIPLSATAIFITGTVSGVAAGLFLTGLIYKNVQWTASYFLRKRSIAP